MPMPHGGPCWSKGAANTKFTIPLAPVLTDKDATGRIRVSEKTSSRQLGELRQKK
jgi:hypothetical protein